MNAIGHALLTGIAGFILLMVVFLLLGKLFSLLGKIPGRCPQCKKWRFSRDPDVEEPGYGFRVVHSCKACGFMKSDFVKDCRL